MEARNRGILQATGIAAYCLLIGGFLSQASKIFPKDPPLTPVLVLILFSTSVLICALIVFYKPYTLFFANKKKQAIDIVVYTAIGLVFYVALAFILLFLVK